MLRRARWFLLLAIACLLGGTSWLLLTQREAFRRGLPKAALPLPDNTSATARDWTHDIKDGDRLKARISARNFRQVKAPATFLLDGLEMRVYDATVETYDLIQSNQATFDIQAGSLYSEGEVVIHMDLQAAGDNAGQPSGRLMKIVSSGVTFDSKTMRVSTERHADFEFESGSGSSEGATYDPGTKELLLTRKVVMDWRGADPSAQPMHLESSHLVYREAASEIFLSPPARLTKGSFSLAGGDTVVLLHDGGIRRVETVMARGADSQGGRQLNYAADRLTIDFGEDSVIRHIEGTDNARLVSSSGPSQTLVNGKKLNLNFSPAGKESVLETAEAYGEARVELRSTPRPGAPPQSPRILTSESIELKMRPCGKEIGQVLTHAPGQVEFPPAKPGDKRRIVTGERMTIAYGANNAIESFRAVQATTRTEGRDRQKKPVLSFTRSQDLQAWFDPRTGQMVRLEQWTNFEYEEGSRRARAERALLDNAAEIITLTSSARIWDESGSTNGDRIVLEQLTGQMAATGNVTSTRLPDKKANQKQSDTLLSNKEPMQARAARMVTFDDSQRIRYEGDAVVWQGASRVAGDSVLIDRTAQRLEAAGRVFTQFPDRKGESASAATRNVMTTVKADRFVYDGKTKVADYAGRVHMERPTLTVDSRRLRAWFVESPRKDGTTQSELDRMFADGAVTFLDRNRQRTRTGSSEHAEYYPREEKTILTGGNPVVNDSVRGITRGDVITWISREDRLIVDNTGSGPSVSRIKRN